MATLGLDDMYVVSVPGQAELALNRRSQYPSYWRGRPSRLGSRNGTNAYLQFWSSPHPRFRRAQSRTTESGRYAALVQRSLFGRSCGGRQGRSIVPRQGLLSPAEYADEGGFS